MFFLKTIKNNRGKTVSSLQYWICSKFVVNFLKKRLPFYFECYILSENLNILMQPQNF